MIYTIEPGPRGLWRLRCGRRELIAVGLCCGGHSLLLVFRAPGARVPPRTIPLGEWALP